MELCKRAVRDACGLGALLAAPWHSPGGSVAPIHADAGFALHVASALHPLLAVVPLWHFGHRCT
eukprot:29064-Alexandrium_andersonii.AAC.1